MRYCRHKVAVAACRPAINEDAHLLPARGAAQLSGGDAARLRLHLVPPHPPETAGRGPVPLVPSRGPEHDSRSSANQSHSGLRQLFLTKRTIAIDLQHQSRTIDVGVSLQEQARHEAAQREMQDVTLKPAISAQVVPKAPRATPARRKRINNPQTSQMQAEVGFSRRAAGTAHCQGNIGFTPLTSARSAKFVCVATQAIAAASIYQHTIPSSQYVIWPMNGAQTSPKCDCVIVACHKMWVSYHAQAAQLAECTFRPAITKLPMYLTRMAASWQRTPRSKCTDNSNADWM